MIGHPERSEGAELRRFASPSLRSGRRLSVTLGLLTTLLACQKPPAPEATTLATLFDSLSAIHRDHPDTGLLRRLHPAGDTILFVEGAVVEALTGDSLFRRVLALHVPVRTMKQEFSARTVQLLDEANAVLTASERVEWTDTAGPHQYSGLLTLVVSRRGPGWVIRAYRGT